jgi:hypothetical protein
MNWVHPTPNGLYFVFGTHVTKLHCVVNGENHLFNRGIEKHMALPHFKKIDGSEPQ